jgi:cation-transporting ATPase E
MPSSVTRPEVSGRGAPAISPWKGVIGSQTHSPTGLSAQEVEARAIAGQINKRSPTAGRTLSQILRANVFTRFNAILGSLLVVVAFVGPLQDGLFGVVLVVNTSIGIAQELRAKRMLDRLAILTSPRARVLRDGVASDLQVDQVVVDDVIEMHPGDQAIVDGIVISSEGLEVDESLLTGESRPIEKVSGDQVLSGSFVVAGTATAIATGVGEESYAKRLEAQARRFSLIHSELQQGTNQILRLVTWVMVPAGIALVLSQLLRSHQPLADALRGSVAGVSAMVPEGLVLLTSIAFAVGALRLGRRRVLVQELAAIEGLARVDVLCIDKTGTLTQPGMQLTSIEPLSGRSVVEIESVLGAIAESDPAPNATMQALAASCPSEDRWVVSTRIPFSSKRKWSATSFAGGGTWLLGAPEVIARDLSTSSLSVVSRNQEAGRRVLLLASTPELVDDQHLPAVVRPAALLMLSEQLRADTSETLRYLQEQDVKVKVLSGDAPETVASIAERAGVISVGEPCDASKLGDEPGALGLALETGNVFGRIRPEQKLEAVKELQARGHVVAMVGDGVNDVQAIKQADLGIAMGSGSQSSRSVARVVLLDSSFSAVPQILDEGRRVISNIGRVAKLFVTKTVYAALLAIVVVATALPYPFFPRHLSIVSTFTIGVPGFFLALSGGAPRASSGFTRRVLVFAVPAGSIGAGATFGAYAIARASAATTAVQARTAAMLALFCVAMWVLGVVARPLNLPRVLLLVGMIGALAGLLAIPVARKVFSLQFPAIQVDLAIALVVACAIGALWLLRVTAMAHPSTLCSGHIGPPPPVIPQRSRGTDHD